MVTLLSWNVAGRVKRFPEQLERVLSAAPDVICLQEVTATTAPIWTARLGEHGWPHTAVATPAPGDRKHRPLCVMTAARESLVQRPLHDLPWPERAISTEIAGIEWVNVHSPISPSADLAKVVTHETLHAHLAAQGRDAKAVVCGDLNTPRREHADGRVWTFARTQHGTLREDRGERWDRAELALIKGLEPYGWRDAWREQHGPEHSEVSWRWARWKGGYRLDHLIVSAPIETYAVTYIHDWREEGLSDHSALLARLGVNG